MDSDGLPVHLCSICAALLNKSVLFKRKCENAQHILKFALAEQNMVSFLANLMTSCQNEIIYSNYVAIR